jgi:hypothetical protein
MTRSGTETTARALRYSGFFWNRVEFSTVEASSGEMSVAGDQGQADHKPL